MTGKKKMRPSAGFSLQFNYLKIRFLFVHFQSMQCKCNAQKDLEEFQLFARNIGHIVIKGLENIMGFAVCNVPI